MGGGGGGGGGGEEREGTKIVCVRYDRKNVWGVNKFD